MENEQNKLIEETLNSLNGIKQATPSNALWNKISMAANRSKLRYVSQKRVWAAAASFVFLLFFNLMIIRFQARTSSKQKSEASTIVEQYELTPQELDIYRLK